MRPFQLAGEIFFDGNEYGHAAHCYALAASAGRQDRSWDRWACALTRQSFVHIYDRQYAQAANHVLHLEGPASADPAAAGRRQDGRTE
jgi:hypothetical protein